jgi:hypothetical protein
MVGMTQILSEVQAMRQAQQAQMAQQQTQAKA